jgi:hypothetical protein
VGAQKTIFSQVQDSSWNFGHWMAALVIYQTWNPGKKVKLSPKKIQLKSRTCEKIIFW